MIIRIFSVNSGRICEVEQRRWDIFPVRRLRGGPVWHRHNARQPPPGTGKQSCHSFAVQSDQTAKRPAGPPPLGAKLESPVEVRANGGSLSKSWQLLPM